MLYVNRYKCPVYDRVFIVVHECKGRNIIRTSPKMNEEQFQQFYKGRKAILFDVAKSSMLDKVNFITV